MTIDFITGNSTKFEEVQYALLGIDLRQLSIHLPEVQEIDPHKIIEAKIQEALQYKREGNFIVEDTSFYMDAIPGLPGPLIKWFLETIEVQGLVDIAEKFGNKNAYAKTIIGYADADQNISFFEGEVKGSIERPRVEEGFGWDLIFIPQGYTQTFAEMKPKEKEGISMRGIAAKNFKTFLESSNREGLV